MLLVCSVVISAYGGFLERAVHAFDLAACSTDVWPKTMLDVVLQANALEVMQPVSRGRHRSMLWVSQNCTPLSVRTEWIF